MAYMPKVKVHFSTHERELLGSVSEGVHCGRRSNVLKCPENKKIMKIVRAMYGIMNKNQIFFQTRTLVQRGKEDYETVLLYEN